VGRNEKQYQKLLDEYLGPATGILIFLLCLFVYRFSMEQSEQISDHLAMNQEEQDLVIPPLASIMDKQGWSTETKNRILQSGDMIGLALGFSSYSARVLGTLRELRGGNIGQSSSNIPQQAAQNGHVVPAGEPVIAWGNPIAGLSQYAAN